MRERQRDPGAGPATTPGSDPEFGDVVERFKPTSGLVVGWAGILLAVLVIGYVVLQERSVDGLRLGLGVALAGAVVHVTQIRPRATAYARHVRLHGQLSDTYIPYVAVNQVALGQTLNVYVGRKRFVCAGVGRKVGFEMRQRVRSQGTSSLFGANRAYQYVGREETTHVDEPRTSYASFVLDRLERLVEQARTELDRSGGLPDAAFQVHRRVAVLETVALVGLGLGFVTSLLV